VILRVRFGVVINSSQFIRVLTVNKLIINAFLLVVSVTAIPAANAGIITGSFSSATFGSSQNPGTTENVVLAINSEIRFLIDTVNAGGTAISIENDGTATRDQLVFNGSVTNVGDVAQVFSSGEQIGPSSPTSPGFDPPHVTILNSFASPQVSLNGYLGFQSTDGSTPYFGWLEVSSTATEITFSNWGYEDSGAAIAAGDVGSTGAVPEPASIAIVGLASIAMLGRRKRRQ
jgi:hypothetical protein